MPAAETPRRQRAPELTLAGISSENGPPHTSTQHLGPATREYHDRAASESPWQSMKASTRHAWDKTVDFVTPATTPKRPSSLPKRSRSWWKRMWGSDENKEGPQTVTEWMAQDRIDP